MKIVDDDGFWVVTGCRWLLGEAMVLGFAGVQFLGLVSGSFPVSEKKPPVFVFSGVFVRVKLSV